MSANETMVQLVKDMETDQIVEVWDTLNQQETTEETYIIRGVLMDELELRNEDAFEQWLDSFQDSPRGFF